MMLFRFDNDSDSQTPSTQTSSDFRFVRFVENVLFKGGDFHNAILKETLD